MVTPRAIFQRRVWTPNQMWALMSAILALSHLKKQWMDGQGAGAVGAGALLLGRAGEGAFDQVFVDEGMCGA